MVSSKKILVVDDEPDLREILQCNLENAGYEVVTAASAEEAIALLSPDIMLVLLDVMLGGMSGFRMAEKMRKELHNDTPIIFLTAKDAEKDLLTGFSAGGDDYICKPFSLHEVLARISAVLRRSGTEVSKPKTLTSEGLTIDFERKAAYVEGMEVRLSPKEFGILSLMVRQPGRVFSRDEILAAVWRGTNCIVIDRTSDAHIARLRRTLGAVGQRLTNRPGYGYCFE